MATNTYKGRFVPHNPAKYAGNVQKIIYRSSWELKLMMAFDKHPDVISWSSECFQISYLNPVKRAWTVYVPDFVVAYQDRTQRQRSVMFEVKPAKEDPSRHTGAKLSMETQMARAINFAKWQAARAFCAKRGMEFHVLTEVEIFAFTRST